MAQLSFDDVKENSSSTMRDALPELKIADGASALVRIMHTSKESFRIFSVHSGHILTKNNKNWYFKVNCLRNVGEDAANCPICAAGGDAASVSPTIYVHLIQYVFNTDGTMQPKAVVWPRNAIFVKNQILPLIDEYGESLPNNIIKISRTGEKLETKYSITVCNQAKYPAESFPMDAASAFDGYDELGTNILDKTFDELVCYASTGNFPYNGGVSEVPTPEEQAARGYRIGASDDITIIDEELPFAPGPAPTQTPAVSPNPPSAPTSPAPQSGVPTPPSPNIPAPQTTPWAQPAGNKPVRRYE